jgi:hypothetical protein
VSATVCETCSQIHSDSDVRVAGSRFIAGPYIYTTIAGTPHRLTRQEAAADLCKIRTEENKVNTPTNYGNEVIVRSCLAAAQVAGQLAGRTGGIWTVNKACTTYIVARSTSPDDLRKDSRYLTIKVVK